MLPKELNLFLSETDLLVAVVQQVVLVLVQQVAARVDVVGFFVRAKLLDVRMAALVALYLSGAEWAVGLVMPVVRVCGVGCEWDGVILYS
jgi:hypothetical protein